MNLFKIFFRDEIQKFLWSHCYVLLLALNGSIGQSVTIRKQTKCQLNILLIPGRAYSMHKRGVSGPVLPQPSHSHPTWTVLPQMPWYILYVPIKSFYFLNILSLLMHFSSWIYFIPVQVRGRCLTCLQVAVCSTVRSMKTAHHLYTTTAPPAPARYPLKYQTILCPSLSNNNTLHGLLAYFCAHRYSITCNEGSKSKLTL